MTSAVCRSVLNRAFSMFLLPSSSSRNVSARRTPFSPSYTFANRAALNRCFPWRFRMPSFVTSSFQVFGGSSVM